MRVLEFVVWAHPVGYTTTTRGSKKSSVAVRKYWRYCERVRMFAEEQGAKMPLESPPDDPWYIFTVAVFADGTHADPENIHKGIKDALFYKAEFGDKHTGGAYCEPLYSKENPCVVVMCVKKNEIEKYVRAS